QRRHLRPGQVVEPLRDALAARGGELVHLLVGLPGLRDLPGLDQPSAFQPGKRDVDLSGGQFPPAGPRASPSRWRSSYPWAGSLARSERITSRIGIGSPVSVAVIYNSYLAPEQGCV